MKVLIDWIKKTNWRDPKTILLLVLLSVLPFVARYYLSAGLVLGCMLSIAILWLVDKSPRFCKKLIVDHPLVADIFLSFLAVGTLGGYFGSGLTLGVGAVSCALILSWALLNITVPEKKQKPTIA